MEWHTEFISPTVEEYCEMRKVCGLAPRTREAAEQGLPRSLFAVSLRDENKKLVAMGRVVGDLGCHVQIVDIAVHPDHQKKGLSLKIMDAVMDFITREVPECAYVNLFADVDYLYQKYGFDYAVSKGMSLKRKVSKSPL